MGVANKKKKIFDDRYEILSIIGRGSQSVVYQAKNVVEGGPEVALKVLVNRKGAVPNSERLRKEALAMVSCNHRYVVRLDDFHTIGDVSYLSMELAPEGDVRKYIERKKTLSPRTIEKFFIQTAEALDYIHKVGIIHRDVKPDNILVLDENEIRLGDFGIALLPGESQSTEDAQMGVGTLDYLSPEILEGNKFDILSDLYSLAICFFEIATGSTPFANVPLARQLEARKNGGVRELKDIRSDIPAYFSDVLATMMRYNASDRFQNAADLLKALKDAREGLPVKVAAPPEPKPLPAEPPQPVPTTPPPAEKKESEVEIIPIKPRAKEAPSTVQAAPASDETPQEFSEPRETAPTPPAAKPVQVREEPESTEVGDEELDEEEELMEEEDSEEAEESPDSFIEDNGEDFVERPSQAVQRPERFSPQMSRGRAPAYPPVSPNGLKYQNGPRKNNIFTTVLIASIVVIIMAATFIRRTMDSAGPGPEEIVLQEAGLVTGETFETAIVENSFDFTRLQPGVYSGMVGGIVPGRQVPFSLIVLEGSRNATILAGVDGWTPGTVALDSEILMQNPDTLRIASNGFVLKFRAAGALNSQTIRGEVDNLITGETSSWVLAPEK